MKYKLVKVSDLFEVAYGTSLEYNNMLPDANGINFISRKSTNNGVEGRVKRIDAIQPIPKNTISVAASGSVMESFLQEAPYYAGRDVYFLSPKIKMNKWQLLYYCMCLSANKYKYSYGRQANKTLRDLLIPANTPDYVTNLDIKKPSSKPSNNIKLALNTNKWKCFLYKDIFDIKKGSRLTKYNQILGNIPYISSSSLNNGVDGYIENGHTDENCITFACYGSIGEVFYQKGKVWVSDNANVFYTKDRDLNIYIAMFLITILRLDKFRFSYGMTGKKKRLEFFKIKLPVDTQGNPDWQFMEDYIKSLAYSSNL